MPDILRMDYINSLPQPFMVRFAGDDWEWEVYDIEVGTGLIRINVMGKLDIKEMGEVAHFTDMNGVRHDPETFYIDYVPESA